MTTTVAATAATPTFKNDEEMEAYYAHPERSEALSKKLCWSDAVGAVKAGHADFIMRNADNGDFWSAFRLYPEFESERTSVVEMTQRRYKNTFNRSRA